MAFRKVGLRLGFYLSYGWNLVRLKVIKREKAKGGSGFGLALDLRFRLELKSGLGQS